MSRKPPSFSPPDVQIRQDSNLVTKNRHYKLITPLYGGGVSPAEADPITIVRGTEVRGHLRFWWRATQGGKYKSIEEMKEKEDQIWGSSAAPGKPGPSPIIIVTNILNRGTHYKAKNRSGKPINNIGMPSSIDSYVAFPLREERNPVLLENIEFNLMITYPKDFIDDIEAALWAWETFGGLGARTRRGFGALLCTRIDEDPVPLSTRQEFEQTLKAHLVRYAINGRNNLPGVPYLSDSMRFVIINGNEPMSIWRKLVNGLRTFRQQRFPDRNNHAFGRSKWPEPDAIRRLTGESATKHEKPRSYIDKFPRGKLGLPIIFQFKEGDVGDPNPTTLQGANHDRLASPLILRPIACSDGAVGLAAVLNWLPMSPEDESYTPPGGLILRGAEDDREVNSDLEQVEADDIQPLNGEKDIIQAFLNYLDS